MFKLLSLLFIVIVAVSEVSGAEYSRVRIDINGQADMIPLVVEAGPKKGVCQNPSWIKNEDKKACQIYSEGSVLKSDTWADYIISFTPQKDGVIRIDLMGHFAKNKDTGKLDELWIQYDDVELTGATVINGSFQEVEENGKLKGWKIKDSDQIIKKGSDTSVKAWYNKRISQNINATKGQTITLKVRVRAVKG